MEEKQGQYSPTSSMDSSSYPSLSSSSLSQTTTRRDLSTDLRLGLSLSTISSLHDTCSNTREILSDWPPIKPLLRSTLKDKASRQPSTFFVKVYMEGIPIGRKLDLLAINGYESLIKTLRRMFRTIITYPDVAQVASAHVLTYEDKEGDWMMVGDVPWEMFLTTVKRLKISRADKC